ncbi:MAG: Na(+)/H(+) antiporter NhaA [Fimbriimonadaceae bacterium]|nr:Na(+)/H(+) antiporter NhaA [Fimbriimonadaceae bacterium]
MQRPSERLEAARRRLLQPFREFVELQASGGILLLAASVAALIWANSPAAPSYGAFRHTVIGFDIGVFKLMEPVERWVNDGLMAIFFLLVGLEIKREVLVGELSSTRKAALPIAAALGGMIVPAVLYLSVNVRSGYANGWAVPMATDIAFSLGVLAMMGSRIPISLKVFLTALAIVDDIGAVLVIAFFYSSSLNLAALAVVAGCVALLLILNYSDVRQLPVYLLIGVVLWLAMLKSGVHATVAGILLAASIPARTRINAGDFLRRTRRLVDDFDRYGSDDEDVLLSEQRQGVLRGIEVACEQMQMPLQRLEHNLHPYVTYLIVPIFALANAGVAMPAIGELAMPASLGVILGLTIGKPLGIVGFAWIACRTNLASLPSGLTWAQMWGVGCLGGIGFTMALFIAGMAITDATLETLKLSILLSSVVAGLLGWIVLSRAAGSDRQVEGVA